MRRNGNPMHVTGGDSYSEPRSSPARCRRGANPFGHNPECDCRDERASQTVPYEEPRDDVPRN